MASSKWWHTARCWAGLVCWLVCSITAVAAQEGQWARVTAAGARAFAQGDYAVSCGPEWMAQALLWR
jgi:hypothetical protein